MYLRGSYLLPTVWGGLPMVVAERSQHGLHGRVHLCVLRFLLLEPIVHERPRAEHGVLRLLFAYIDGVLANAGQRVVLGIFSIYTLHLLQHQDGLGVKSTHILTAHRDEPFNFFFFFLR